MTINDRTFLREKMRRSLSDALELIEKAAEAEGIGDFSEMDKKDIDAAALIFIIVIESSAPSPDSYVRQVVDAAKQAANDS